MYKIYSRFSGQLKNWFYRTQTHMGEMNMREWAEDEEIERKTRIKSDWQIKRWIQLLQIKRRWKKRLVDFIAVVVFVVVVVVVVERNKFNFFVVAGVLAGVRVWSKISISFMRLNWIDGSCINALCVKMK